MIAHASSSKFSWNREKVLEAFRKRVFTGKSLAWSVVGREFSTLAAAATRHFGSYGAAIEALGIDYEGEVRISRARNNIPDFRRRILSDARRLAAMPKHDWKAIKRFREKYRGAFNTFFGSWDALAAEAGIPVDRLLHGRDQFLDRAEVLESLQKRHQAGLSVRSYDLAREDRKLKTSVLKHFGKHDLALRAADIPQPRQRNQAKYKDPQAVLDAIVQRKADGRSLRLVTVQKGPDRGGDYGLSNAATRHFRSWQKALAAAGFDPHRESPWHGEKYPSAEFVIEGIRRRHAKGQSLRATELTTALLAQGGDQPLYNYARKFFGSWKKALVAAGVDPGRESSRRPRKYPSAELVLEAIRRRRREGLSLDSTFLQRTRSSQGGDVSLIRYSKNFFGSWEKALDAALLPR